MSNEKWYSIATPEQLIKAVTEGLHVECMRHGTQVRTARLTISRSIALSGEGIVQNEVSLDNTGRIQRWLAPSSQYKYWKVLDNAGRIPWGTLPV